MKAATANSDDFDFQQICDNAIEAMKNHESKNRIKNTSIISNIHLQFFTAANINYELNNTFKTAIRDMQEIQRRLEQRQNVTNALARPPSFGTSSLPSTQQPQQQLSLTRGGNRKKSKKRKNKKNKNKSKNKNKNKSKSKKSKKKSNKKRKTHRK